MRNTIQVILTYVVEHCEELSTNKFSGVYFITNYQNTGKDVYRVHKGTFIPPALDAVKGIDRDIALVVGRTEFKYDVKWDAVSYWLTISK